MTPSLTYWTAHPYTVYVPGRKARDFRTFRAALMYAADALTESEAVCLWHEPSNTLVHL